MITSALMHLCVRGELLGQAQFSQNFQGRAQSSHRFILLTLLAANDGPQEFPAGAVVVCFNHCFGFDQLSLGTNGWPPRLLGMLAVYQSLKFML